MREQHYRCFSPTKTSWWSRVWIAALFAFHLNYIPLHLATAAHLDSLIESVTEVVFHHEGHDDADHHHDSDHHTPHPASDHTLNLTAQTQLPSVAIAFFCVLADISVVFEVPQPQPPIPVLERIKPPGESPPGPLQPRAPPLA